MIKADMDRSEAANSGPRPRDPGFAKFSMANLSIKHRLPLLMSVILIGVIVSLTWAAYRAVKLAALETGGERLKNLTQQLANLTQASAVDLLTKTTTAANEPAVLQFLQSPSASTRSAVAVALRPYLAPQDQISVQVELWDASQTNLMVLPEGPVQSDDLKAEFAQCSTARSRVVGKIRSIKNQITYPVVAAVGDSNGKPIGYLVRWRRVSPTANGRKQLADLLGNNAELYFGNVDGDIWTDLENVITKPPVNLQGSSEISHYQRNGQLVMGLGRPIRGTPWLVVVEFPDQIFLSPANAFLKRMVVIGLILLTIGLLVAFLLSRSITRPLYSLTQAASRISDGDYSHFVPITSRDELGVLGKAFNVMTARVRDSQHELESEVHERTAQLKAANKELEAFSYSVSHDLRAPLRHINGFSQSLLEDYEDQLDEVGKGFLRELRSASKEMAQLIDEVLELARITRSDMHPEVVNLSELAQTLSGELQRDSPERPVIVNIEDDLLAQGDRRLLRIMLSNLLENALKFTSKRERPEIFFGRTQNNGESSYFVRDNGAGFEMAYVHKLFSAFQRLHSAREFEGTGIGLATVQRIVQRHGGNVWAEGVVDQGATFYFTLPGYKEVDSG